MAAEQTKISDFYGIVEVRVEKDEIPTTQWTLRREKSFSPSTDTSTIIFHEKQGIFPPSSGKPQTLLKISGHHLKWIWAMEGTPSRKPDYTSLMRKGKVNAWHRKYWKKGWKGCTIVSNLKTLEIWVRKRKQKKPEYMISKAWNQADLIARQFSKFANISLKPIESEHPMDLQSAHLVVETDTVNQIMVPLLKENRIPYQKTGVGWITDKSHEKKAEATGAKSAEGIIGFDWLCLYMPGAFSELKAKLDRMEEESTINAMALNKIIDLVNRRPDNGNNRI